MADRSATGASEGVEKCVGSLRNVGGTEKYGKAAGKVRKGEKVGVPPVTLLVNVLLNKLY